METPAMGSRSRNTSGADATPPSIYGDLSRTATAVLKPATTRRLQLKSALLQQKLDWYTAKMSIKASIPPAVLVCAIQSDTWINHFKTNAYLAPIISTCVLPALPRAMLLRHNIRLTLGFVLTYCWTLLAGWCGVQARQHTTHGVDELSAYNSSAEAVVAIFLMFYIWFTFTLKSAYPGWGLQCTIAGIFAVATLPGIARAPTMSEVIDETNIVLETFLVGQAVGLVNALILFPQSCRGIFKKDIGACLDGLVAVTQAQRKCMEDISLKEITTGEEMNSSSSVGQLEDALQKFVNDVAKTRRDGEYAAREISWGIFDHSKIEEICCLLVDLIPPASGLSSVADMLQLHIDECHFSNSAHGMNSHLETDDNLPDENDWQHLETAMRQSSEEMSETIIRGAEHAKFRLEITKGRSLFNRPRARVIDEEHHNSTMNPGGTQFLESYRNVFDKSRATNRGNGSMDDEKLLDRYIQRRPQIGNLGQYTSEMHSDTLRYFLFLHVSFVLLCPFPATSVAK